MIAVIIPTYQERDTIAEAVRRVLALPIASRVIVVDDASTDGTKEVLARLQQEFPVERLQVIHRPAPRSFSGSYIDGFRHALQDPTCEAILECDADGSHPFERIPELVQALEVADVCVGSRYVPGGNIDGFPRDRLLLSSAANLYLRWAINIGVRDITAGFVAYRRAMLERIPFAQVSSNGYAFQIEMKHLIHTQGGQIREIPITFIDRSKGHSKMSMKTILEAFGLGMQYLWKR